MIQIHLLNKQPETGTRSLNKQILFICCACTENKSPKYFGSRFKMSRAVFKQPKVHKPMQLTFTSTQMNTALSFIQMCTLAYLHIAAHSENYKKKKNAQHTEPVIFVLDHKQA